MASRPLQPTGTLELSQKPGIHSIVQSLLVRSNFISKPAGETLQQRIFCVKRILRVFFLIISFGLFFVLEIAGNTAAETFCVDTAEELTSALTTAASNGELNTVIQVEQGHYIGTFIYDKDELFMDMGRFLTIKGGYTRDCASRSQDPADTILYGSTAKSVLTLSTNTYSDFSVDGIMLQNGVGGTAGGGLFVKSAGYIKVSNCIVSQCSASRGGGIYVHTAEFSSSISDCIVSQCSADNGGGIYLYSMGSAGSVSNCIISNNSARYGGGAYVSDAGGINLSNNVIINNETLADTSGGGGGGAYLFGENATITVTNNTFSNNSADSDGGGLRLDLRQETASAHLYNNIVWNNIASQSSDIFINNDADGDSLPSETYLMHNNFDQSDQGFSSIISIALDSSNMDNVDPMFLDADNDAFYLRQASLLRNVGSNAAPGLQAGDKDSNLRIVDSIVDLGAYEYQGDVAEIAIVQTLISFGEVAVGSSASQYFEVYNTGGGNLTLGNVAQTDMVDDPFSIIDDNCSEQVLAEAESCLMGIQFTPTSAGSATDSFDLLSNDADETSLTVNIHGLGVQNNGDGNGGGCFIDMP
jgi:hypothetical protein